MQYKGGDFNGRLELPVAQFHAALAGASASSPGSASPLACLQGKQALLLMHHPESWLSSRARTEFRQSVYKPRRFAVCLHGHLHEGRAWDVAEAGGAPRAYFQVPSLFGMEHYGSPREERLVGYAWGSLTPEGEVRVWPMRRIVRGDDEAAFDRDSSFHCQDDGSVVLRAADAAAPRAPEPEQPAEPDLEPYLDWATARYRGLSLIGVGGGDVRLDLDEVYVLLHIARRAAHLEPDLTSGKGRGGHGPLEVDLDEVFERPEQDGRHVLILGDPGAGKTTVLRKLPLASTRPPKSICNRCSNGSSPARNPKGRPRFCGGWQVDDRQRELASERWPTSIHRVWSGWQGSAQGKVAKDTACRWHPTTLIEAISTLACVATSFASSRPLSGA